MQSKIRALARQETNHESTADGVGIALIASQAHAISRYQSTRMSCDEVRSVISEEGAVTCDGSRRPLPTFRVLTGS